jgi:hypothetical protein
MFAFRQRPTAEEALKDEWLQLAEERCAQGEVLSTKFLKEFKYRHKWVVSGGGKMSPSVKHG